MVDPIEFKETIIIPTLQFLDMQTDVAVNLVLGTAIQESLLTYTRQLGGGPALGYYQCEPFTHNDCWINYLAFRPKIAELIWQLSGESKSYQPGAIPNSAILITNHHYATALCRIKYKRAPAALPSDPNDIMSLARFWKQWYNTPLGKGTAQEFYNHYVHYIK